MNKITVKAGADHLEAVATSKPIQALSELIWNGFDAKSHAVYVSVNKNTDFEAIDKIVVMDYGEGIPYKKVKDYFGNLGESWKKEAKANGDRSLHGQYGRGRFKAFSLGGQVKWTTVYKENDKFYEYNISSEINSINDFNISEPAIVNCNDTYTKVEISNLLNDKGMILSESFIIDLTKEFALFLTEYPKRKLIYGDKDISPTEAWSDKSDYELGEINFDNGEKANLSISIIEWNCKVQREIHFCDENGFSLFKEKLNNVIRAPGFDFTVYAKSKYFKTFKDNNTIELGNLIPEIKILKDQVVQKTKEHFLDKIFIEKTKIIEDWKKQEIYPYSGDIAKDTTEIIERKVFDILAVNVQSYLKSFDNADNKTKKFTFKLLSQAIKDNPDSVQKIISEVLGLKKKEQDDLAELLHKTTLSSIISASKIVSDRLNFLNALDDLVHNKETKKTLLERDQLHKILEKETWIFREDFYLSGSEQRLEEVLEKHIKILGERMDDNSPVLLPNGKQGRVDLMLAKARKPNENLIEYLIIELKRPSKKIDVDVLTQIERYAIAVCSDERFYHKKAKWTFIAVSNQMDEHVRRKTRQRGVTEGKVFDDSEFNLEVWVMTWAEVIHLAKSKLNFFSEQLSYEASRDSAMEYLEKTHNEYLPVLSNVSKAKVLESETIIL